MSAWRRYACPAIFITLGLDRLYTSLAPQSVIEIGSRRGRTRSRMYAHLRSQSLSTQHREPIVPLKTETHIYAETSDEFFARRGPDALLAGQPLGVGFIDGLHLYEQALKDFINLEKYCGPRSVDFIARYRPLGRSHAEPSL